MHYIQRISFLLAFAAVHTGASAHSYGNPIPEIIVSGHVQNRFSHQEINLEESSLSTPDVSRLMTMVPGGNMNDNGPISGQTQYRGMFGPRMNVRLDGMYVNSGGPNWMDPPLHYMPVTLLDSLEATRGIASVSYGNGIGGHVIANYKSSRFTDSPQLAYSGEISLGGHSADAGYNVGGILALASDTHRMHVVASRDAGSDRSFPGGEVAASEYRRYFAGAGYGFTSGDHTFSFDYRYSDTGDSGNPVLPLDIDVLDTHLVKGRYEGTWGPYAVIAQANYSHVDHRMHNYVLRPAPDFSSLPLPPFNGTDRRFVTSDSTGTGYSLEFSRDIGDGLLNFGLDGHLAEHNATVGDPDVPPFYVVNFDQAGTDNFGLYAEWRGDVAAGLNFEAGIRYNRVTMDTRAVDAQPANLPLAAMPGTPPFAVRSLRDAFNAADRGRADNNLDWVAKLDYALGVTVNIELGFARKTRSPSYIERYLWIPLEVNAGLGDGNNYVGDIDLDPEVSHQAELGLNWQGSGSYFAPRAFYRRVDDYIQGVPASNMFVVAVSTNANGDANPLRFANVEAEIYGVDAMYGHQISGNWRLDGIFSYTRGRRLDIDDNLYRIAPPNARLSLKYTRTDWSMSVEGVAYARQDNIAETVTANSAYGNSRETPGYGLLNLYGSYHLQSSGLQLRAGVENLLDRRYTDHLSGFNRVLGGDVPVGARLPGIGRNFYASIAYRW